MADAEAPPVAAPGAASEPGAPATTAPAGTATASSRSAKRASRPMGVQKNHVGGLLTLLGILDLIVLGLAANALNKALNGRLPYGTLANLLLALLSILAAGAMAVAIISGWIHFKHYNSESVASASSLALIAWAITWVAFGLACKAAAQGDSNGSLKALEAFVIMLLFFSTLYVVLIHAGLFSSKYGVGYKI